MRTFGAIIIAVWVSWFSSDPALAEKRVALVIGNSAYENVARLGNPANDATAMTETFKEAGFDVVDSRRNLNIADMRRAFRDFSDKAKTSRLASTCPNPRRPSATKIAGVSLITSHSIPARTSPLRKYAR